MDIKDLVSEIFKRLTDFCTLEKKYTIKYINPARESNKFIKQLKRLVKDNDVNYESLSGNTLSEIRRNFFTIINTESIIASIKEKNTGNLLNFLLFIIEVSFFIYSMDIRVRTTYIITQIIVRINELIETASFSFRDDVRKKIYDESVLLLGKLNDKGKANQIETLNLLVSIKTNSEQYPIGRDIILSLFDLRTIEENGNIRVVENTKYQFSYFQAMVLSSFIENSHPLITNFIEEHIIENFDQYGSTEIIKSTELVCTFFDSLSNPYFSEKFKKSLFQIVSKKISEQPVDEEVFIFIKNREWFFTWKKGNLSQMLMKKELRSPY